jgi:hypothetical protein
MTRQEHRAGCRTRDRPCRRNPGTPRQQRSRRPSAPGPSSRFASFGDTTQWVATGNRPAGARPPSVERYGPWGVFRSLQPCASTSNAHGERRLRPRTAPSACHRKRQYHVSQNILDFSANWEHARCVGQLPNPRTTLGAVHLASTMLVRRDRARRCPMRGGSVGGERRDARALNPTQPSRTWMEPFGAVVHFRERGLTPRARVPEQDGDALPSASPSCARLANLT